MRTVRTSQLLLKVAMFALLRHMMLLVSEFFSLRIGLTTYLFLVEIHHNHEMKRSYICINVTCSDSCSFQLLNLYDHSRVQTKEFNSVPTQIHVSSITSRRIYFHLIENVDISNCHLRNPKEHYL